MKSDHPEVETKTLVITDEILQAIRWMEKGKCQFKYEIRIKIVNDARK